MEQTIEKAKKGLNGKFRLNFTVFEYKQRDIHNDY